MRCCVTLGLKWSALSVGLMLMLACPSQSVMGQEKDASSSSENANEAQDEGAESDEQATDEPDPFQVPEDGTVEELFQFMDDVRKIRPKKQTRQAATKLAKKVFPAIMEAAEVVMAKTESDEEFSEAVARKISAYDILVRYDSSVADEQAKFVEKYAEDERPMVAAVAAGHLLSDKVRNVRGGSEEDAQALAAEVLAYADRFGVSKMSYRTISGAARTLGYTEHTEVAAGLYESLAPLFGKSDDEDMRDRADSMIGSARRLRLLGNPMEVFGTLGDGSEVDWDGYKGKVVLVDFWASWCGPCIRELPNMKKNLELYGEKGFTILGVNMDSTRRAFERCVESKEITWSNLFCEEEGKTGWASPMAVHYGITGIPTAILVDQQGKVVSLRARGSELDEQLSKLLGPPESEDEDEPAEAEAAEGDEENR